MSESIPACRMQLAEQVPKPYAVMYQLERSTARNRVFRNCHRIVGRGDERDGPVLALGIERELLTVSPTCL
jgi:hypothetical protein